MTPADHAIADSVACTAALRPGAVTTAAAGGIVVLGIWPTRPETGYGYIRTEAGNDGALAARVIAFEEKPDLATAQRYVAEGHYFWNSGMFVLRSSTWLAALERFRPDIAARPAPPGAWRTAKTDPSSASTRRRSVPFLRRASTTR